MFQIPRLWTVLSGLSNQRTLTIREVEEIQYIKEATSEEEADAKN